jgi:hypothetical protein
MKALCLIAMCVLGGTRIAAAQIPSVENGTLDVRALSGALDRELDTLIAGTTNPMWLGYAVATNQRGDNDGCWIGSPIAASIAFASRHPNARSMPAV